MVPMFRRVASWSMSSGLHVALLTVLVLVSLRPPAVPVAGDHPAAVLELSPIPEKTVADVIADNQQLDEETRGEETLSFPGGEIDVARIRAAQHELFPWLTDELPEFISAPPRQGSGRQPLFWYVDAVPDEAGERTLSLTDAELNRIVDAAWSRRDRWRSFVEIATLVNEHDPDAGRAAELVRAHVDRNLLQPYNGTRPADTGFWGLLNLAVDQQPLIRFIERFTRQHPGSRVSTELLFFLDELVQANRATLLRLIAIDPVRELALTRQLDPEAYDLALAIHYYYFDILRSRQLASPAGVNETYDEIRIHVLSTILSTTPDGYGAADARYLLGRVYWDQKRYDEAIESWRGIQADSRGLFSPYYEAIVPAVQSPTFATNARIMAAFGAERVAWRRSALARLKQFGYTPGDY